MNKNKRCPRVLPAQKGSSRPRVEKSPSQKRILWVNLLECSLDTNVSGRFSHFFAAIQTHTRNFRFPIGPMIDTSQPPEIYQKSYNDEKKSNFWRENSNYLGTTFPPRNRGRFSMMSVLLFRTMTSLLSSKISKVDVTKPVT